MASESTHYYSCFDMELFEGVLSSHIYPWHYHNCYTIVFIEKGSMKYVYTDKEVIVEPNQIHVVNPFISHYNFPITECVYKAVFLPVNHPASTENQHTLIYFEEAVKKEKGSFSQLHDLFSRTKLATSKKTVEKIQSEIWQLLFQDFAYTIKQLSVDRRIIPAIEFINKNLDKKLTVKKIAGNCYLSPYHFQRIFKAAIGLTVNDFIQQQRTNLGKKLIREGHQIVSTAFELGYFDQSHFNKAFKKMWVAKPTAFK